MTTASCPLATALWGARFAGVWLPSCYTTWGDTTSSCPMDVLSSCGVVGPRNDPNYFQQAMANWLN